MKRNGSTDDISQIPIDNLTYAYKDSNNSNQLMKVTDAIANNANFLQEFKDSPSNSIDDYSYDANGNMTKDNNKNITSIAYNHLNLPTKITFATTGNIVYIYNASGQKVQKIVNDITKPTVTTDYLGGYQYNTINSVPAVTTLKFFPTAEGYVEPSGSSYKYIYQYKDHLGNIRLSYDKTFAIKEESNYYPFGLKQEGYNNVKTGVENKYKYQGQERQDELGLNWDSFKWRNYDYVIGRFMCVDPLAEKYPYNSTYAFQENKLGMGVELEGLELAPRNPVSGFGNYVKGKYDSAVSSIKTTTEKAVQAVSSAISSLGINQSDGYTFSGSKEGISDSTGFFPEAKGAKSSATLDGDVIVGLADAYGPDLGANKVMDGANIFSNLAQDPYVNKAISAVTDKTSATASASSSNSNGGTVTVERGKYTATGTVGNTASTVNRKVQDTVVKTSDAAKVKAQNTKDSIKAVNQNNKINANTNFTD